MHIFFVLESKLVLVRIMKKESHLHGTYQYFVREVGAPEVILVINWRTQVGKKWTKTSRNDITRQQNTILDSQQSTASSRTSLRDGYLIPRRGTSWYYCTLEYHWFLCATAYYIQSIIWITPPLLLLFLYRTPMETEYVNTPNISMFWFRFWETDWYYKPTTKYPEPNFLPAYHIGIS